MTFSFEDEEVRKMLNGYVKRVRNPKPLLKTLEKYVHAVTMKMFRSGSPRADHSAVRGVKWPRLAESTINQKAALMKRGLAVEISRPLVRTGKMRGSIKVLKEFDTESRAGFEYGTDMRSKKGYPFPAAHNVGMGNRPPKRWWLFLTGQDLRQMVKSTIDHVQGQLKATNTGE